MSGVDSRDFRTALGQFPTGVTVVTALDAAGAPVGLTVSSFNAVSLDPPLVLWSLDKKALSLETFRRAASFAVNVLAADQVALSNRFAGRGEDKFAGLAWTPGLGGAPLLEDCAARFQCKTWAVYEGGDHIILVGQVEAYDHAREKPPLVFSAGRYAATAALA